MVDLAKTIDDLEAIRTILDTLNKLPADDQRRVMRFIQEKLGIITPIAAVAGQDEQSAGAGTRTNIRTFIQTKNPTNDVQFAAAVAYFYAFDAPQDSRKPEIGAADLQDATRQAGRERLKKPIKTLGNANTLGYLDKGATRGMFKINTVGENLVAMALPATGATAPTGRTRKRATKRANHK